MNALVLRQPDKTAQAWAPKYHYELTVSAEWALPAERTLFVAAGASVPYALLEAGFGRLDKWDVAAPLWRYGMLAADVGTSSERARTEAVTKDLRMLLYAHELLFVRNSPDGRRFLATWLVERQGKAEPRLAFLRALHIVKPIFCALPRSWLQESVVSLRPAERRGRPAEPHKLSKQSQLTHVEIAPGRYVCCRPEEAEKYRQRFKEQQMSRKERRIAR